ncbi:alpha-amylase family glycosyl hydrolase [Mollicutes bacterium LVI A0039]|nr:alpha-amylase family glycosyl hydrolase [Mollicutes bacterium LVI A0039]
MFIKTPYEAYLDSYTQISIPTTEELVSVKLETAGKCHTLDFAQVEAGYVAKVDFELDLQKPIFVHINNRYKIDLSIGMITTTTEFDVRNKTTHELGAIYTKEATQFRVWSPVATQMILMVNGAPHQMNADGKHYSVTVKGDLENARYYYIAQVNGQFVKVIDPYAYNLTFNNQEAVVTDLAKIKSNLPFNPNDKQTMVIYETSVCDFTSDLESDFEHKGKFISFATTGKKYQEYPIGIDHVKDLGVSHIQLMPIYDFGSVNEQFVADNNYNWGYDPTHYNVPEGSYATNDSGNSRIVECQQMIADIKAQGLGVIMDVVYNHVYDASTFNFNLLVPNYYLRFKADKQLSDGSFCGNEVASERAMVRRYIIDTLTTWVKYYRIDGIRIDLMGLMDIETIGLIEQELKQINPNFIIYGEGWNMECGLPESERATQINANKLPSVGHFNDDFRDFIKGNNSDFSKIGYVQGNRDQTKFNILMNGQTPEGLKTYVDEYQLINYVSCHDDHTLYDYLKHTTEDEQVIVDQIIECYEHIFRAKGIPFIHSGCEMKRTKDGEKNTYNKSRQLNAIKWNKLPLNRDIIEAIKVMIYRRKNGKYE